MSMSTDANRFRVVRSPYFTIKAGMVGVFVRKIYMNYPDFEMWELDFDKLGKWNFRPSEVVPV